MTYLQEKMSVVAPNLAALIGDVVAARLISHAGQQCSLLRSADDLPSDHTTRCRLVDVPSEVTGID